MTSDATESYSTFDAEPVVVLTVPVPYRKPGNVVEHLPVHFEVFRSKEKYSAVPFCGDDIKRLTNMPDGFVFNVDKGRVVCNRINLRTIAEEIFFAMR